MLTGTDAQPLRTLADLSGQGHTSLAFTLDEGLLVLGEYLARSSYGVYRGKVVRPTIQIAVCDKILAIRYL
jgi:hypothetical protein